MSEGGPGRPAVERREEPVQADVETLRSGVEAIDDALVELLARRLELARALGELKRAAGMPTLDPAREAEVVGRAAAAAREREVPVEPVRALFWTVVELCRSAQRGDAPPAS